MSEIKKLTWLEQHHIGEDMIADSSRRIRNIARRLGSVGFDKLAGELFDIADYLEQAYQLIRKVVNDKVDADFHQAWSTSGTILKAALAGTELAKNANNNGQQDDATV